MFTGPFLSAETSAAGSVPGGEYLRREHENVVGEASSHGRDLDRRELHVLGASVSSGRGFAGVSSAFHDGTRSRTDA